MYKVIEKILKDSNNYTLIMDNETIIKNIIKNKFNIETKKDKVFSYIYLKDNNNNKIYEINYDVFGNTIRIYNNKYKEVVILLSYGYEEDYIILNGKRYSVNNNNKIRKVIDSIYYDIFKE